MRRPSRERPVRPVACESEEYSTWPYHIAQKQGSARCYHGIFIVRVHAMMYLLSDLLKLESKLESWTWRAVGIVVRRGGRNRVITCSSLRSTVRSGSRSSSPLGRFTNLGFSSMFGIILRTLPPKNHYHAENRVCQIIG